MSLIELAAVVTAILYVVLASYKSILCWAAAIVSTILYFILCWQGKLYAESGLQVFYLLMAIYGWINWKQNQNKSEIKIVKWPIKWHMINLLASAVATIGLGIALKTYTQASLPFLDSFTTVFSIVATFMVIKRVLENWVYWIVIDAAAIYLYASRGFVLSSFLFGLYVILAAFGLFKWYQTYKSQQI